MANGGWRGLEPWERVKWARARRFETAAAAAAALGMKEGTYRCYERGPGSAKFIPLEYKHALQFAREFGVRWEWLLEGAGEPGLTEEGEQEAKAAPNNFLRAWREYRNYTVGDLAKKSGLGAQTITALESGEAELSPKLLSALATALSTRQGFLLSVDPKETDPALFDAVAAVPKERRGQALEILKTFRPYNRLR